MSDRLDGWRAAALPWLLLAVALALVLSQIGRPERLPSLWPRWAEIGVLAVGMTAVIVAGGIDLSVGSTAAMAGMVLGVAWKAGAPIALAALAAVATGFAAGLVNGLLIAAGIPALVATLATMALYSGIALDVSQGDRIAGLPAAFTRIGQGSFAGLAHQVWLLLAVAAILAILLHATRFGRYVFAIGDNRTAARFAAVPVRRVETTLYAMNGLLAGIVGVFLAARGGAAIPDAGLGLELEAIACVVLGGTRVTGGFGSIGRTLLGMAVLAHLDIGLLLVGTKKFHLPFRAAPFQLDAQARLILTGLLLILLAVWNEKLSRRRIPLLPRPRSTNL